MFELTDDVIDNTICNTSAYIVATVASNRNLPIEQVAEAFFSSKTFALLRNKDTGYYWDSIAELIESFEGEIGALVMS